MEELATLVSAVFLLIGSLFALVASVGLLRLPDLYTRMHAASKAGTMGSCMMLIALAIHASDVGTVSRALAGGLERTRAAEAAPPGRATWAVARVARLGTGATC